MTFNEYRIRYWRMYKTLEKDFMHTLEYVELDIANYSTFSIPFAKQLLSIGSEMDNVFRECIGAYNRTTISDYFPITQQYPTLLNQEVIVKDTSIRLIPFQGWNSQNPSQSLTFWYKYNLVKHDRVSNAKDASLETVLNALAGLFIVEMYRFDFIYNNQVDTFTNIPDDESDVFVLNSWSMKFRGSKAKPDYAIRDDESHASLFH